MLNSARFSGSQHGEFLSINVPSDMILAELRTQKRVETKTRKRKISGLNVCKLSGQNI